VCRSARQPDRSISASRECAGLQGQQQQAAGTKEPRIEIVRVKQTDSAAPRLQFRLSDGVVDLMRGVSLDSFDGIGNAWKTPSFTETFDSRYGRW